MNRLQLVDLTAQDQPFPGSKLQAATEEIFISILIAIIVFERMPIGHGRELVESMREKLIGLIHRPDEPYLAAAEHQRRLLGVSWDIRLRIILSCRQINAETEHKEITKRSEDVIFGGQADIA